MQGVIFLDEMLKSILEMDKKSRLQAEEAEEAKRKAFDELTSIRTSLIEKRLSEAKKTVEEVRQKEHENATEKAKTLKQKADIAREKLNTMYTQNSERWASEIFEKITG